jgi:hypothetical protein
VALAAGNSFTLDLYGDKLITLAVGDQIASKVIDVATGKPLKSLVKWQPGWAHRRRGARPAARGDTGQQGDARKYILEKLKMSEFTAWSGAPNVSIAVIDPEIDVMAGPSPRGRTVLGGAQAARLLAGTEYFRRQADICLRLSLIASSDEVSDRLIAMAQGYKPKPARWKRSRRRRRPP